MKQAIKINLGGMVFHIDEDAYEKLKTYLGLIEGHFSRREGGKEVISDIESRMAELFQSRLGSGREAIILSDVEEVIAVMGDPMELADEEEKDEYSRHSARASRHANRRLYRDPDNAILGGVCSGLAAYFGIDPVVMRIIAFVLLILGHGVTALVYLVMWIAIPKALTISQKLEMKGETVTVSNIERTIHEEMRDVKANFKKMSQSDGVRNTTNAIGEIFAVLGKIIMVFIKIILGIIGFALIFSGIIILLSFTGLFFFKGEMLPFGIFNGELAFVPEMLSFVVSPATVTIALIALFLFIAIPLIAIIYGGLKLIFNFRAKDKTIGLLAFLIWVVSLGTLFTLAAFEGSKFTNRTPVETVTEISAEDKTIYLRTEPVDYPELTNIISIDDAKYRVYYNKEDNRIYGVPWLYIRKGKGDVAEFEVRKLAFGQNKKTARLNSADIEYLWRQEGNVIYLPSYFDSGSEGKWKFSEVSLYLRVPEGYKVVVEEGLEDILNSITNVSNRRLWSVPGKTLEVTESGIHVVSNGE